MSRRGLANHRPTLTRRDLDGIFDDFTKGSATGPSGASAQKSPTREALSPRAVHVQDDRSFAKELLEKTKQKLILRTVGDEGTGLVSEVPAEEPPLLDAEPLFDGVEESIFVEDPQNDDFKGDTDDRRQLDAVARAEGLVNRAARIVTAATAQGDGIHKTTVADREAVEERLYLDYVKLQDQQDEFDLFRRNMGVDHFSGNFLGIKTILEDGRPAPEGALGDWDTYERVQEALKKFVFRRAPDLRADDGSNFVEKLKTKLHRARETIDGLKKNVADLGKALKASSSEARSAQQLVTEQASELNRVRFLKNTLMTQLRQIKSQRVVLSQSPVRSGGADAATGGVDQPLADQLAALRNDFMELANVNWRTENENRLLKARISELEGEAPALDVSRTHISRQSIMAREPKTAMDAISRAQYMAAQQKAHTRAVLALESGRRVWQHRLEMQAGEALALLDVDANVAQQRLATRNARRRELSRDPSVDRRIIPPDILYPKPSYRTSSTGTNAMSPPNTTLSPRGQRPAHASISIGSGSELGGELHAQAAVPDRHSSSQSSSTPVDGDVDIRIPVTEMSMMPEQARGWAVLREKILSNFALSRAECLRREELHLRRLRHKIAMLTEELAVAAADRDMIAEHYGRCEQEIRELQVDLAGAHGRADALQEQLNTWQDAQRQIVSISNRAPTNLVITHDASPTADVFPTQQFDSRSAPGDGQGQVRALTDIFNARIQNLEKEIAAKGLEVERLLRENHELQRHLQNPTLDAVASPSPTRGALAHSPTIVTDHSLAADIGRLERELLTKERIIVAFEQEVRKLRLQLTRAENEVVEERATRHFGITINTAVRVVSILRMRAQRARGVVAERRAREAREEALRLEIERQQLQIARYQKEITELRTEHSKRGLLQEREAEEAVESERGLLRQIQQLSVSEGQRDLVQKAINQLGPSREALMESSLASSMRGLQSSERVSKGEDNSGRARDETQWSSLRKSWLRLILLREEAWRTAPTVAQRASAQKKLTEAYEMLLRAEQAESSQTRPSVLSEAALRVVSQTAAPITLLEEPSVADGSRRAAVEDIEREWVALKELVKTRQSQLLELEARRDEVLNDLQRISVVPGMPQPASTSPPRATDGKPSEPTAAQRRGTIANTTVAGDVSTLLCAKYTTVSDAETLASIAAQLAITAVDVLRLIASSQVKVTGSLAQCTADHFVADAPFFIPLQTLAQMESIVESVGPAADIVLRHRVRRDETAESIALRFGVPPDNIFLAGTRQLAIRPPNNTAADRRNVFAVDVRVPAAVAWDVLRIHPQALGDVAPNRYFDDGDGLFYVLPTPPPLPIEVIGRVHNVAPEDLAAVNISPRLAGVPLLFPLSLSHTTATLVAALIANGPDAPASDLPHIVLLHETGAGDTQQGIAECYGLPLPLIKEAVEPRHLRTIGRLVEIPILTAAHLTAVVPDEFFTERVAAVLALAAVREDARAASLDGTPASAYRPAVVVHSAANLAKCAFKPLLSTTSDDQNHFGEPPRHVLLTEVVVVGAVAAAAQTMREWVLVPNAELLPPGAVQAWAVRVSSAATKTKVLLAGFALHAIVHILDLSIADLFAEFGVTRDDIARSNPEISADIFLDLSAPVTGWLRLPLASEAVLHKALAHGGDIFAVVPAQRYRTREDVAVATQSHDISIFEGSVDPAVCPAIIAFARPSPLADRPECWLTFTYRSEAVVFPAAVPERCRRIQAALERDLFETLQYLGRDGARGDGRSDHVRCVSVVAVNRSNEATVAVCMRSYEDALAARRLLAEEGDCCAITRTQMAVSGSRGDTATMLGRIPNIRLRLCVPAAKATILSLKGEKMASVTLQDLALRHGCGTTALLSLNPDLFFALHRVDAPQDTTADLAAIRLVEPPGFEVIRGETVLDVAGRIADSGIDPDATAFSVRCANTAVLPLAPFAKTIRVPPAETHWLDDMRAVPDRGGVRIAKASGESLLSLATAFECTSTDVIPTRVTAQTGSCLKIAAHPGKVLPGVAPVPDRAGVDEHVVNRGDTVASVAKSFGLTERELILLNASVVKIPAGTLVAVPRLTSRANAPMRPHLGFLARHVVSADDTLTTICARYNQSVTAVMRANPQMYVTQGVHLLLVPVDDHLRDDVLSTPSSSVFTIVVASAYDTITNLSRRFDIDVNVLADVNKLLTGSVSLEEQQGSRESSVDARTNAPATHTKNKKVLVPVRSAVGKALARQQGLSLYIAAELRPTETIVAVADRFRVFAKDIIPVGRRLNGLGIREVLVPITRELAEGLNAEMVAKPRGAERTATVMFRFESRDGESKDDAARDLGVASQAVEEAPSGSLMVPVSAESVDRAMHREAGRARDRAGLAATAQSILFAIRSLTTRNEATQRELQTVEDARAAVQAAVGVASPTAPAVLLGYNMESVGAQTDAVVVLDEDYVAPVRIPQKQQHCQTVLSAASISLLEGTVDSHARSIQRAAEEAQRYRDQLEGLFEQKRVIEEEVTTLQNALSRRRQGSVSEAETLRSKVNELELQLINASVDRRSSPPPSVPPGTVLSTLERSGAAQSGSYGGDDSFEEERSQRPGATGDSDAVGAPTAGKTPKKRGSQVFARGQQPRTGNQSPPKTVTQPKRPPQEKPSGNFSRVGPDASGAGAAPAQAHGSQRRREVAHCGTMTDHSMWDERAPLASQPRPPTNPREPTVLARAVERTRQVFGNTSPMPPNVAGPNSLLITTASPFTRAQAARARPEALARTSADEAVVIEDTTGARRTHVLAARMAASADALRGDLDALKLAVTGSIAAMNHKLRLQLVTLAGGNLSPDELQRHIDDMNKSQQIDNDKRVIEGVRLIASHLAPQLASMFATAKKRKVLSLAPFIKNSAVFEKAADEDLTNENWVEKRLAQYVQGALGAASGDALPGAPGANTDPSVVAARRRLFAAGADPLPQSPQSDQGVDTSDLFPVGFLPPIAGASPAGMPLNARMRPSAIRKMLEEVEREERERLEATRRGVPVDLQRVDAVPMSPRDLLSKNASEAAQRPAVVAPFKESGTAPWSAPARDSAWSPSTASLSASPRSQALPPEVLQRITKHRPSQVLLSQVYNHVQSQLVQALMVGESPTHAFEDMRGDVPNATGRSLLRSRELSIRDQPSPLLRLRSNTLSDQERVRIAQIRAFDRKMRREGAKLLFQRVNTQVKMRALLNRFANTTDASVEREGILRITRLWRGWLKNWGRRRRTVVDCQRRNVESLASMFAIGDMQAVDRASSSAASPENVPPHPPNEDPASPTGYFGATWGSHRLYRAFSGQRLHHMRAVQPPTANTADQPSSSHFRDVVFDGPGNTRERRSHS